ncbi:hypothetical protein HAZT_HAZT007934 [Hyalella azteca]|uniref:Ig-like domain-containing protein n=1 Tax=Hyalella azteca TaxID=294128 RepID=A0A6A0GV08_HYAAZ|nr:hypothetical protein HAZT_HAZT007934 [Hyalella azteca]
MYTVPPDIIDEKSSSEVVVQEGNDVTLRCHATGSPKPTISWKREDGGQINLSKGINFENSDTRNLFLKASLGASFSHSGRFRRRRQSRNENNTANLVGKTRHKIPQCALVRIEHRSAQCAPHCILVRSERRSVPWRAVSTAVRVCRAKQEFLSSRVGSHADSFVGLKRYKTGMKVTDSEVLHIPKVSRLHMGAYLCIASNDVPPSVSKRITLKVQCEWNLAVKSRYFHSRVAVEFVLVQQHGTRIERSEGEAAAEGDVAPALREWEWGGDVTAAAAAAHAAAAAEGQTSLAPVLWIPNQLVSVSRGMDVELVCHTEAFPRSINYWSGTSGNIILSSGRFDSIVAENGYKAYMKLKIRDMQPEDFGTYGCSAKNSFGESNGTIKVYEIPRELIYNAPPARENATVDPNAAGSNTRGAGRHSSGQWQLANESEENDDGPAITITPDGTINYDVRKLFRNNAKSERRAPNRRPPSLSHPPFSLSHSPALGSRLPLMCITLGAVQRYFLWH